MLTLIPEEDRPVICLTLPWPPSVNTYWRHVNGRTLISKRGREYRRQVGRRILVEQCPRMPAGSRLAVTVEAHPPDRRKRDLDNIGKSLLDSLEAAAVFADDELIDDLRYIRRPRVPGGQVKVRIEALA